MAKASINFQVATSNSEKHIERQSKVTYLLDPDSTKNEYQTFRSSKDYLSAAKVAAKKITGRTMQKLAEKNFVQEAVVNLESHHTLKDVKNISKKSLVVLKFLKLRSTKMRDIFITKKKS